MEEVADTNPALKDPVSEETEPLKESGRLVVSNLTR
jgi:hypothetical protein